MLSANDEAFLREKGYIDKFVAHEDYYDDSEEYEQDKNEDVLQSELLLIEQEYDKTKNTSKKNWQ